jgi:hypothetical protein
VELSRSKIILYLPNRPELDEYSSSLVLSALGKGKVQDIIEQTGNHWRKIFSIYAKIAFIENSLGAKNWQEYRDHLLLSKKSQTKICFTKKLRPADIHIISGQSHAECFDFDLSQFIDLDSDGKIKYFNNIYLVPYFDYRQLPNELLAKLIDVIIK